jgi:hypothetical protein
MTPMTENEREWIKAACAVLVVALLVLFGVHF